MRARSSAESAHSPRTSAPTDAHVPGRVQATADRGVAGAGGALPFLDAIQRSFGHHDVSRVQAYVGGPAAEAADAIDAEAYATGDKVAFRSAPSLHIAAHEAAHVVQQRAGVHRKLDGGPADPLERHADEVADAVVRGASAEALLDRVAHGGGGGRAVQRLKLTTPPRNRPVGPDHVHDTADRVRFRLWVEHLGLVGARDVLVDVITRLRAVPQLQDHEAIALSLAQRALDKLLDRHAPAPMPECGAQPGLRNLPRDRRYQLFIEGNQLGAGTDDQRAMCFDNDESPGHYHTMTAAFTTWVEHSDGRRLGFDDYDRMHRDVTRTTLRQTEASHEARRLAPDRPRRFEPVPHELSANDVTFPLSQGEFPNPEALHEMLFEGVLGLKPTLQQDLDAWMVYRDHRDQAEGTQNRFYERALHVIAGFGHHKGLEIPTAGHKRTLLEMLGRIYQPQFEPQLYASMIHPVDVTSTGNRQLVVHTNRRPEDARASVDALFQRYYAVLAAIHASPDTAEVKRRDQLRAIARLVRALHVGHYFHDANGRLNTMLLLNRLLVDCGFSPVVMERTDIFGGGWSADELVLAIEAGLMRFAIEAWGDRARVDESIEIV